MGYTAFALICPLRRALKACGTVDAVGEGVDLLEGMRVIFTAIGVWQEYVVVDATTLLPTPEGMPDEVACQAFVNPYTAFGMLEVSGLQSDQWLLLTAGGSAFGQFVIQLCQQRGINTICTVRRSEQVASLKELGATEVINTEEEKLVKRVYEITARNGVDYVFDAVAGTLGGQAADCLTKGGTPAGLRSPEPGTASGQQWHPNFQGYHHQKFLAHHLVSGLIQTR